MNFEGKARLKFESRYNFPYGYWTCDSCPADFYGGGEALHHADCPVKDTGYKSCMYHFGPKEATIVLDLGFSPYAGALTIEKLAEFFPRLVDSHSPK